MNATSEWDASTVLTGLCARAPLQLCRLTGDGSWPHPACATEPLLETPLRIERPATLILGLLGMLVCFDRVRAVFGEGYTAVRAKLEYAAFFFLLACWNAFAVLDHCFFTEDTPTDVALVLIDTITGPAAAAALALAAIAELGTVKKSKYFLPSVRKVVLAAVLAVVTGILLLCWWSSAGPGLQAVWLLLICAGASVYIALVIVQIVRNVSIRLIVLLSIVGAIEFGALLCLFLWGASLCTAISPWFGGEELFHLLTVIAVWAFYFVFATVKGIEAEQLREVRTADGELILMTPAHQNTV